MATIKDVAREAGVAVSTVSKYINGGNVLEENRQRIEAAIEKFDYQMNFHAQAMRRGTSGLVLVMVPRYDDDYCCEIMRTAREMLLRKGFISVLSESNSDPKREQEIMMRAVKHQTQGVIALYTDMNPASCEELRRHGIPLVVIGKSYRKHAGCVYFDDSEKYLKLFRKLKENGHTRVGVIGGCLELARQQTREFAYYVRLFKKAGLEIDDSYIYIEAGSGIKVGASAVDYFEQMKEPPSALICMNSDLLMGAYIALSERGLRVPQDVSLCATADAEQFKGHPFERFDAVLLPIREATEKAIDVLVDNIRSGMKGKRSTHTTVQIAVELHSGTSIGPCSSERK